jgi:hypothetical protein
MKTIDDYILIENIEPFSLFEANVSFLLKTLINDFGIAIHQETFDMLYKRISFFLKRKYKDLSWREVRRVFEDISSGKYGIKKICVAEILSCFNIFKNMKFENRKMDQGEEIKKQDKVDCTKFPMGKAIILKFERKEDNYIQSLPLKELAEKLKSGEIKSYISNK